jgi:hypothetical protein
MIKRIIVYKNDDMEKILKQCLGIDVSKLNLSLSLGFLTEKLEKQFMVHGDVKYVRFGARATPLASA